MYVCVLIYAHQHSANRDHKESMRSPITGVSSGYEPSSIGAGNKSWYFLEEQQMLSTSGPSLHSWYSVCLINQTKYTWNKSKPLHTRRFFWKRLICNAWPFSFKSHAQLPGSLPFPQGNNHWKAKKCCWKILKGKVWTRMTCRDFKTR